MATASGSEGRKGLFATKDTDTLVRDTEEKGASLARVVGLLDLTALGLGAIIGTGIFVVIGEAIGDSGPAIILSFVLAGITCAFSALAFAELASSIPVSGSAYTYSYATLGRDRGVDHRLGPDPRVRGVGRGRRGRLGPVLQQPRRLAVRLHSARLARRPARRRRIVQPAGRLHRARDHRGALHRHPRERALQHDHGLHQARGAGVLRRRRRHRVRRRQPQAVRARGGSTASSRRPRSSSSPTSASTPSRHRARRRRTRDATSRSRSSARWRSRPRSTSWSRWSPSARCRSTSSRAPRRR